MADKQNTTQNITAPNNDLEILKKNFPHCFDKSGDFDFEKFKKELAINEINFSKESYSMDWLGKSYARLLATDPAKTLIKEDKEWNSKEENKNSENLLIKGDNLEVLKHLSNAYHEKVKMIYIDPPYNTGSDGFVYADDRKFTTEQFSELAGVEEEQAKKILSFVNSKSNSHSAWLTFMYPRLYIAKQLLKDDGVIFVSIDDNEVAQLRILMDEIFGEENFVGDLIRKTRTSTNHDEAGFNIQHENCIIYSKNKTLSKIQGREKTFENYKNPDNDLNGDWISDNPVANLDKRTKINNFEIKNPYTNKIDIPSVGNHWRFNEKSMKEMINNGKFLFKQKHKEDERGFILKRYKKDLRSDFHLVNSLDCITNDYLNQVGTRERNEIFDKDIFDYPKPSVFIKEIISYSTNSNDLILDFFAGSGTTGDAVMQLNAEDRANGKEGNRKYILVQLPEKIDPKKNKTAYDFVKNELHTSTEQKFLFPTIFDITKERLVRAGKKIQSEQKADLFTGENTLDFGFKIFETQPIWEDYEFEAKEFDAQTKLFDESKLSSEDLQTLLTTWKTYDNISLTESLESVDLDGYIGQYGNGRLYLMNKGFETKHLKAMLNKIDEDTTFNPVSIIVFGYHFESKVLREIAENVSNYANKKKLDIDFITRY